MTIQMFSRIMNRRFLGKKSFVIISHPRSGTNFLRSILNQHDNICATGEPFHCNPKIGFYSRKFLRKKLLSPDDVGSYLTKIADVKRVDAVAFTVFNKESGHALDEDEIAKLVLRDDLKVVFLVRKNLLKAFVSLQRAHITSAWHVDVNGNFCEWAHSPRPLQDALDHSIGPIDVEDARRWIGSVESYLKGIQNVLQREGKAYHLITYENLCLQGEDQTRNEVERLLSFLQLRPLERFNPLFGRTASQSFYESIPNRRELCELLGYDLD